MEVFKLHQEYAHSRGKKDHFCALVKEQNLTVEASIMLLRWDLSYKGKYGNNSCLDFV
jgi:hypothetical protein